MRGQDLFFAASRRALAPLGLTVLLGGALLACNPDKLSCAQDADCGPGATCDPVNKWCSLPTPPDVKLGCYVNKDCGAGQVCSAKNVCEADTVCGADGWCRVDPLIDQMPFSDPLQAVWGVDGKGLWAVGDSASILFYDGTTWQKQATPVQSGLLLSVWGSGPTDIYAVGEGGLILHSADGKSWTKQSPKGQPYLTRVWGTGPKSVYAVGAENGTSVVLRSTDGGATWGNVLTKPHVGFLHGIWGPVNEEKLFVVGENQVQGQGPILMMTGGQWTESGVTSGNDFARDYLRGVFGTAANAVWAVGDGGVIYYYDGNGTNWRVASSGVTATLYDVSGSGAGNVLAVGALGTVLKLVDQGTWAKVESVSKSAYFGSWSPDNKTSWIVGYNGVALRRQQ